MPRRLSPNIGLWGESWRIYSRRRISGYVVINHLKGTMSRYFRLLFFSRISFPQAPEYTIRVVLNFFENSRRYSQLKVCHRCQWHRWKMQKIFNHKSFNYLVWTPLGSIVNLQFTLRYQQPDIVPIICHRCHWHRWQICRRCRWYRWQIATGVIATGGKFATGINNTSETGRNLPPVSLIAAEKLPPVSLTPVANLPLVSLIPVVHLYLRISPRIFEKIRNGPNGILWGWEETDSWKKPEAKNLVTLSL
jgi:hypothetical protein